MLIALGILMSIKLNASFQDWSFYTLGLFAIFVGGNSYDKSLHIKNPKKDPQAP